MKNRFEVGSRSLAIFTFCDSVAVVKRAGWLYPFLDEMNLLRKKIYIKI